MRLLDSNEDGTFRLTEFAEPAIPPYAILSHVWGKAEDEVNFKDIQENTGGSKSGYEKIRFVAEQAKKDGLQYFWVDTCCIDKSSSAEVAEAVNSMYRWYSNSDLCYVYMSDVSADTHHQINPRSQSWDQAFRNSRWFTRGWTLQELLAPKHLQFFDLRWHLLGSKRDLRYMISTITNISPDVLAGQDLERSSIAQRMSWAAHRVTTRSEDTAYALMGLFNVNMPLLYGEGRERAFYRLQEQIIKRTNDHSIFAWALQTRYATHGPLAPSPAAFMNSQHIVSSVQRQPSMPYNSTNRGLQITLPIAEHLQNGLYVAALDCIDQRTGSRLGIYLKQIGKNRFIRTRLDQFPKLGMDRWVSGLMPFEYKTIYIPQVPLTYYRQKHRFRFHQRMDANNVAQRLSCPYVNGAKILMTASSMCGRCPARRAAAHLFRRPRQHARFIG